MMKTYTTGSVSSIEKECGVKIKTVLRIRPLLKKERDDEILLEEKKTSESNDIKCVVLHQSRSHATIENKSGTEYHFDNVLSDNTSQDRMNYTLGLPIVTATMNSLNGNFSQIQKSHLLISMGVKNSGKAFSCFGELPIPKRRTSQDGLAPRLLDSLFSQSNHLSGSSKGFIVQISMVQITESKGSNNGESNSSQIHDLLAVSPSSSRLRRFGTSPVKKKNLNVRNMAARFERSIPSPMGRKQRAMNNLNILDTDNLQPTIKKCHEISEAREILQNGLSTSQKLKAENMNSHLYITMQPMVDKVKVGDKICILDMSSLENEKLVKNPREKEAVASNCNRAANETVLNCLRVLKHNSNAGDEKTEKLQPVPFQHHKVTMVLKLLFLKSSFVDITVLVTAYPGHFDFQQKKNLLDSIKMHGITFGTHERNTTMLSPIKQKPESNVRNRSSQCRSRKGKRSTHAIPYQVDSKNFRSMVKVSPSAPRLPEINSIHNPTTDSSLVKCKTRSLAIPGASDSVTKSNDRSCELEQGDQSSLMHWKPKERKVESSAPVLSEVQRSIEPSKLRECALDFPGIQITPNTGKKSNTVCLTSKDYSVISAAITHECTRDERARPAVVTRGKERPCRGRIKRPPENKKNRELKTPLYESSRENCESTSPKKIGKVERGFIQRSDYDQQTSESKLGYFYSDFSDNEHKMESKNDIQIKELEEKLKETLRRNKSLEQACLQLEKENTELKQRTRQSEGKILRPQMTKQEEAEFGTARKLRLEAQNKIKAPIKEHLQRVNYIYDIKNQWCMTSKQHFSLTFPDHFQRAPMLDLRDKENEQFEGLATAENTNNDNSIVVPTHNKISEKVVKSPKKLSALRKLADKTKK